MSGADSAVHAPRPVFDLFAGGGMFSEGARLAGHPTILAVDNWPVALAVHEANHPQAVHECFELGGDIEETVRLIRAHLPIGEWHLHGSPPCQDLSNANASADPERGMVLVRWYLDLVERLQPTSWSMEQVPNVRHHLPSTIATWIVNAADYGVPQSRRRVFAGRGWQPPPATHSKSDWVSVADALPYLLAEASHLNAGRSDVGGKDSRGRKAGGSGPLRREIANHPSFTITSVPMFLENISEGRQGRRLRSVDEPAATVTSRTGGQVRILAQVEQKMERIRNLTIAEAAILQGLRDDYDISSAILRADQWQIIGNGVCPAVAAAVFRGIERPGDSLLHWMAGEPVTANGRG